MALEISLNMCSPCGTWRVRCAELPPGTGGAGGTVARRPLPPLNPPSKAPQTPRCSSSLGSPSHQECSSLPKIGNKLQCPRTSDCSLLLWLHTATPLPDDSRSSCTPGKAPSSVCAPPLAFLQALPSRCLVKGEARVP
eukprot:1415070-Pyramimonas_sp.AAC.2